MAGVEKHSLQLAQSAISDVTVTPFVPVSAVVCPENHGDRLRELVTANFQFVWRILRRMGVSEQTTDDICQEVFVVASSKLTQIELGKERSFLFGTALRLARQERRQRAVAREVPSEETIANERADSDGPDELVDAKRRREMLDKLLAGLPEQLRTILVLYELEGLSSNEIAELLNVPIGTVGSRLRRAREQFHARAARLKERHASGGDR